MNILEESLLAIRVPTISYPRTVAIRTAEETPDGRINREWEIILAKLDLMMQSVGRFFFQNDIGCPSHHSSLISIL
jgi:hypothetical protein